MSTASAEEGGATVDWLLATMRTPNRDVRKKNGKNLVLACKGKKQDNGNESELCWVFVCPRPTRQAVILGVLGPEGH